ncbi:MAG: DUF4160 domain-containing protein [Candidatus Edwardsbacteria bacterium]|nr:DUF4160 domain-containing protein [Candidatus Edwardsbacteria bacterium]
MPIISRFFGIIIMMYWRDHSPPHFHAKYGDFEVEVEIKSGATLGYLPPRALGLVHEWREIHKDELLEDWRRAETKRELKKIKPLE